MANYEYSVFCSGHEPLIVEADEVELCEGFLWFFAGGGTVAICRDWSSVIRFDQPDQASGEK